MYITRVPNRGSPPAVLLRESYREDSKVKTRTLANLSRWPEHKVEKLQRALKGLPAARDLAEAFEITRSLPHGHVAAVLATARGLRTETATSSLGEVLAVSGCDEDDLYARMDWVLERQERIENALAARHLANGTLGLYDVSSAAFEGRTCPLGAIGSARGGGKG